MKRHIVNQKGFTALEGLLIVIILGIIGGTGYYVWHSKQQTDKTLAGASNISQITPKTTSVKTFADCQKSAGSTTQQSYPEVCVTKSGQRFTDNSAIFTLDNGKVSFKMPDNFEVATALDPSIMKKQCYETVSSQVPCLDNVVLVLKSQGYTNGDQFQISVSAYQKDTSLTLEDWFSGSSSNRLGISNGAGSTTSLTTFENVAALEFHDVYTDEDRVSYAIANGSVGVVVHSNTFSGSTYYSYQNTSEIDYRTYLPVIKTLAQSIVFSN